MWHYPLFSFARLININTPSKIFFFIFDSHCIYIIFFKLRYFETPFRKKDLFTRKQIFLSSLTIGLFIISLGVIGVSSNGLEGRFTTKQLQAIQPEKFNNSVCQWTTPIEEYSNLEFCEFGDLKSSKNQ